MEQYQIVGAFRDNHCPGVCWGGWTTEQVKAEERLRAAQAYNRRRVELGGQPPEWVIRTRPVVQAQVDNFEEGV